MAYYSNFSSRYFQKVLLMCIIICMFLIVFEYLVSHSSTAQNIQNVLQSESETKYFLSSQHTFKHNVTVSNYYEKRANWKTSKLGAILFKNEKYGVARENITFVVLIWKYWDWLKERHIHNYNSKRNDPLEYCSVKNCKFTGDNDQINTADAVIVHIQHGLIPNIKNRNPNQRWIFLSDESPLYSFSMAKVKPKFSDWANVFNWSMTYRVDADIPVPYGRTVPLEESLMPDLMYQTIAEYVPNWKEKSRDVLAAILISNCVSWRMNYLNVLQNYMDIDIHGMCSESNKNSCPGHFRSDCGVLSKYFFYLSFENSICSQYMTEKLFQNAYTKGAIPVIMGPSNDDCKKLLPPKSYIYVDDFDTPEKLAKELINISKNNETLLTYHQWRNNFKVVNEHGYFGSKSYHYCRVCEALNYNDESPSVYDENSLRSFLDPKITCKK